MRAAGVLLGALVGHASLRVLALRGKRAGWAELGTLLGALVAADAPALRELDVADNDLGDVGLAPSVAALPRNTHLRVLVTSENGMSERFVRERLLPAVRANTTLQRLYCTEHTGITAAAAEAH